MNIARLNADGSVDASFKPATNASVYALALQPDGKILVGGNFGSFGGEYRVGLARLNPDGSVDSSFNPAVNGSVYALLVQGDGKILVGGNFTQLGGQGRNSIGRLNGNGTLDLTFNPDATGGSTPCVYTLTLQTDGKIVVGGFFTQLGGQPRSNIGRLNADGTLESSFNPGATVPLSSFSYVRDIKIQENGAILVGGYFTQLGGQTRNYLGRLNPDGSLDTLFNPGASGSCATLALQTDGKIVVAGYFTQLGGQTRNYLGRLNADGSLDSSFPDPGANSSVNAILSSADGRLLLGGQFTQIAGQPRTSLARLGPGGTLDPALSREVRQYRSASVSVISLQPDGKALVGGDFLEIGGQPHTYLGRVNADGTVDNSFNAATNDAQPGSVKVLAVQPDGKIVVGGFFSQLNGVARANIGRLNADGTLDTGFNPGAPTVYFVPVVSAVLFPTNGKILVAGGFSQLGGQPRNGIGQLNANGTIDNTFTPGGIGTNQTITTAALQTDGRIIVGGIFTQLNGLARKNLGRLNADGTLDSSFTTGTGNSDNAVAALAVQPDDKILIGGQFLQLGGQSRKSLARLNPDGTLDTSFTAQTGDNEFVSNIRLQADGKIIVGGNFSHLNGQLRNCLGRLNSDGTLDASFNAAVDGSLTSDTPAVKDIAVQSDGRILVGGNFTQLTGQPRTNIGRLIANGPLATTGIRTINNSGTTVTITLDSFPNFSYQLQRSSSLIPAAYTNVGSPQAGTGNVLTFTDSTASGSTSFYRVTASP